MLWTSSTVYYGQRGQAKEGLHFNVRVQDLPTFSWDYKENKGKKCTKRNHSTSARRTNSKSSNHEERTPPTSFENWEVQPLRFSLCDNWQIFGPPPPLVFKRNRSVASSVLFKNVPTCFLRLCHKSESCARETAQSAKSSIPRSHKTHTKSQACSSGSVTATVKAVRITCAGKVEPGRQSLRAR